MAVAVLLCAQLSWGESTEDADWLDEALNEDPLAELVLGSGEDATGESTALREGEGSILLDELTSFEDEGSLFDDLVRLEEDLNSLEADWDSPPAESLSEEEAAVLAAFDEEMEAMFADDPLTDSGRLLVRSLTLSAGARASTNVLNSSREAYQSWGWEAVAEGFVLYETADRAWRWTGLGLIETVQYPDLEEAEDEYLVFAFGEVQRTFQEGWKASARVRYLFSQSAFDATLREFARETDVTYLNQGVGELMVEKALAGGIFLRAEALVQRDFYGDPREDFTEPGIRWVSGWRYGKGALLDLMVGLDHRVFDTRDALTARGITLTDEGLNWFEGMARLRWREDWEWQGDWRHQLALSGNWREDNGEGYYDRYQIGFEGSLDWEFAKWTLGLSAEIEYERYPHRVFRLSEVDDRQFGWDLEATFSIEREISRHLRVYAEWMSRRTWSNLADNEIEEHRYRLGARWEF